MVKVLIVCFIVNVFIALVKGLILDSYWKYSENWYKDMFSIFFTFSVIGKDYLNKAGRVMMFIFDIFYLPASIFIIVLLHGLILLGDIIFGLFFKKENL